MSAHIAQDWMAPAVHPVIVLTQDGAPRCALGEASDTRVRCFFRAALLDVAQSLPYCAASCTQPCITTLSPVSGDVIVTVLSGACSAVANWPYSLRQASAAR